MKLTMGCTYGKIGVEILDEGRSPAQVVAIVNLIQSRRLDYLDQVRSRNARNGEPGHQAEQEAQKLEASLEGAQALARLFVEAPAMLDALRHFTWLHGKACTCQACQAFQPIIARVEAA